MHIPPLPTVQLFSNYLKEDKAPFISTDANSLSYTTWIRDWTTHLSGISDTVLVPLETTANTTPLDLTQWQNSLSEHPNTALVHFFISGISQGFKLGFNNPSSSLKSARKNKILANEHPEVVDEYLAPEIAWSRVARLFEKLATPGAHISRFGVIHKMHSKK